MPTTKEGDRVRIVAREPTEDDVKSQMYFAHYAGLTGSVQKVYSKDEVAVGIEPESLTKEIRARHVEVRDQMKTKWLDGLSEEGRSRLTEREKDFNLRYVVLVAMKDLEKAETKRLPTEAPEQQRASAESRSPGHAATIVEGNAAQRRSLAEIDAAEEAELLRRAQKP